MPSSPKDTPPSSPAKWAAVTSFNLQRARTLTKDMLKEVRTNEKREAAGKRAAQEFAQREKERMKSMVALKAKSHGEVIDTASKCMRDVEGAISQTEDSMNLLRRDRFAGFAALQVCTRRSQIRDKRPASERVRDGLTEALTSERKHLEAAREEYFELEHQGRQLVEDLTNMRAFLSRDTGERRLVMKHDLLSLKPYVHSSGLAQLAASAQETATSSNSGNLKIHAQTNATVTKDAASSANKDSIDSTRQLIAETLELLARAQTHREKTAEVLVRRADEARKTNVRTEEALAKKCESLADITRTLKSQVLEVEAAIAIAERSLDKSEKRTGPSDKKKREKILSDRQLLEELRSSRETLHQDIQNKFIALELDNTCRRVTPIKASEQSQQPGQPGDKPALASSQSAPNLRAGGPTASTGGTAEGRLGPAKASSLPYKATTSGISDSAVGRSYLNFHQAVKDDEPGKPQS